MESGSECLAQSGQNEVTVVPFANALCNDLAGHEIFDARDIPTGATILKVSQIAAPYLMWIGNCEVFQQVFVGVKRC
ncbi:MAG: hypothetical protein CL607_18160 [Anaerolineaceae bacterium]|nr:hypothetical protein [Anaerolineaceae bacterium]